MSSTDDCPTSSWIFQEFFVLLGKMVQSDLVRQIEYLKVENQILRSKAGKRITPQVQHA